MASREGEGEGEGKVKKGKGKAKANLPWVESIISMGARVDPKWKT